MALELPSLRASRELRDCLLKRIASPVGDDTAAEPLQLLCPPDAAAAPGSGAARQVDLVPAAARCICVTGGGARLAAVVLRALGLRDSRTVHVPGAPCTLEPFAPFPASHALQQWCGNSSLMKQHTTALPCCVLRARSGPREQAAGCACRGRGRERRLRRPVRPTSLSLLSCMTATQRADGITVTPRQPPFQPRALCLRSYCGRCGACGRAEPEESLLLCDGCEAAYHMACVRPTIAAVPPGDWLCHACEQQVDGSAMTPGAALRWVRASGTRALAAAAASPVRESWMCWRAT